MFQLQQILDETYEMFCRGEDARHIIRRLEVITINMEEVVEHIYPFLKKMISYEPIGGCPDHVIPQPGIITYVCEKYFNQIGENGYYKSVKLNALMHILCLDCERFFDLVPTLDGDHGPRNRKCTYCGSSRFFDYGLLKLVKIDSHSKEQVDLILESRNRHFNAKNKNVPKDEPGSLN